MNFTVSHTKNCGWHVDQYPWECDCGALEHITDVTFKEGTNWVPVTGSKWTLGINCDVELSPTDGKWNFFVRNYLRPEYHSFRTSKGREWDIINGWRTEVKKDG